MTHWEHGYRVHGLWDDEGNRLGAVGLGPRGRWDGMYRWWTDTNPDIVGEEKTLWAAKDAVERAVESERRERTASRRG